MLCTVRRVRSFEDTDTGAPPSTIPNRWLLKVLDQVASQCRHSSSMATASSSATQNPRPQAMPSLGSSRHCAKSCRMIHSQCPSINSWFHSHQSGCIGKVLQCLFVDTKHNRAFLESHQCPPFEPMLIYCPDLFCLRPRVRFVVIDLTYGICLLLTDLILPISNTLYYHLPNNTHLQPRQNETLYRIPHPCTYSRSRPASEARDQTRRRRGRCSRRTPPIMHKSLFR
jgi:hypothetical protein